MKWKLSLPDSPMLVYYYVKLTGLAPFVVKNERFHPPTRLGKFYPAFIAGSYLIFLSMIFTRTVTKSLAEDIFSPFIATLGSMLYFGSISSVFFTLIMFSLMSKKIVCLMNKLCIISDEFKSLSIEEDHGKFFKNLIKTIAIGNAAVILSCILLILMEPDWPIYSIIRFCIDSWFSLHTIITFSQLLIFIRQRFTLLNKKLSDLLTPVTNNFRIFIVSRNDPEGNQARSEGLTVLHRIRKIEALHLELCGLVDRTTHLFAVPIFLNSFRSFVVLTLSFYRIYFLLQVANRRCSAAAIVSFNIDILHCIFKIVTITVPLFFIPYASTTTCKQGNAMKAVVFKVWIDCKSRSSEITNEFFNFCNQLLHTKVTVTAFGFMDFDYSFIFKIFCTVLTYLIVIIQLDVSRICV